METVAYLGRAVVHTTTVRPPPWSDREFKKKLLCICKLRFAIEP